MKSEKPTVDQLCEFMDQVRGGRITRAMLTAFLKKPELMLGDQLTEQKIETIIIARYPFKQITNTDGSKIIELGEFEVDSDQSLSSKLEVRGFDITDQAKPGQNNYNSWINQERFPYQQKGKSKVCLALINTGKEAQYKLDFKNLADKVGRKLCDHAHGLTIEEKYPDLQSELYMLMLGACGRNHRGNQVVLVLGSSGNERWFDCDVGDFWADDYWALVSSAPV